jgi:hypothetical protein
MLENLPNQDTEMTLVFFPARLSQARALSQDVPSDYQTLVLEQEYLLQQGYVHELQEQRKAG